MARSRFLLVTGLFHGGAMTPAWPGYERLLAVLPESDSWVAWRLIGSNHRELARSARVFPNVASCVENAAMVQARIADAEATSECVRGNWTWVMALDGVDVAMAGRLYQRQVESDYCYRAFLAAVPEASAEMRLPRPRVEPAEATVTAE